MNRSRVAALAFIALLILSAPSASLAFTADGCGSGACTDCHSLTREEAVKLLGNNVDNVLSVGNSPVKGLWEVAVEKSGQRWPVYVDFSKEFVVAGQIVQLSTKRNLTGNRVISMNRVDASGIPLDGAIVVGKKDAKTRIIIFDDPDCPHCARLHQTAKELAAKNPDIVFFVKPYPRNNDAPTYEKALSVVCLGTPQALDDVFAKKPLPKGECASQAVKETIRTAERLKIRSTPTMVFPDGRVVPGAMEAEAILSLLAEDDARDAQSAAETPKK